MTRRISLRILAAAVAATSPWAQNVIQRPASLYTPGDTVTWVKRLTYYCEGPAWNPATGDITFSQIGIPGSSGNRPDWPLWRIKPGVDTGGVFYNKGQGNGQEMAPNGRLSVIQRNTVIQFDSAGNVDTLVASGANGVSFDADNTTDNGAGNDLSFGASGAFYFTNLASGIFYVNPAGQLSQAYSGASSANGIYWIEEQNAVYVHEGANIRRYEIGTGGALINRTTFVNVTGMGSDGGCLDSHGNQYVADYSQGMLRIFNTAGQAIGSITLRVATGAYNVRSGIAGGVSNCTFGGPDLKTLYITGDGGLYSIPMKISGRARAGATALKPAGPKAAHAAGASETRDLRGRLLPEKPALPLLRGKPR